MSKSKNQSAAPAEVVNATDELSASANELVALQAQASEAAKAMATRVNYEGALTVGGIEDEIRFYQRRTVETCLELGKRLLVLKELTPHGEFQQRIELLGIGARTAQTFMGATIKTLKSETVSLLTNRVKNVKAFLELVTHDDEAIEDLSNLDDFDKMSASELRKAARELKADNQAKDEVLDATQQKLTKAQLAAKKKVVADTDWPDALQPLADQVAAAGRKVAQGLSELEICRITLFDTMHSLGEEEQAKFAGAMAHIADVYEETLDRANNTLAKERSTFDKTLGDYGSEARA
jgi:hypothetical protein